MFLTSNVLRKLQTTKVSNSTVSYTVHHLRLFKLLLLLLELRKDDVELQEEEEEEVLGDQCAALFLQR